MHYLATFAMIIILGDRTHALPALTRTTINHSQKKSLYHRQDGLWTPAPTPTVPPWTIQPSSPWSQPPASVWSQPAPPTWPQPSAPVWSPSAVPSWAVTTSWPPIVTPTANPSLVPPLSAVRLKQDNFGSTAWIALGGVVALLFVICLIWAWRQHRRGLRPFDISGCCKGRRHKNLDAPENEQAPLPLSGTGRHYDQPPMLDLPLQAPVPTKNLHPLTQFIERYSSTRH